MNKTPPPGYLNRKIAQSADEAISQHTADHIKTIVKATIQKYIESYFNQDGGNREMFKVLSKMGLQYVTDKSFDASSDPTLRKTQLARLFEQVRQELPCILILDSGFEYIHQNWTGLDRVWYDNKQWYGQILITRNMKITIAVGTRDQSSTDFLHGLLSVLFGEYRFMGKGQRITGNQEIGETWVVKIGTPTLGTVTQQAVNEDPKDRIWMFNIELENVLFEDAVSFKQPLPTYKLGTGVLNQPDIGWTPPIIYMPATIPINSNARVQFQYFQPDHHQIIIVDPNVATIHVSTRTIYPRRLGTTQLQVIRPRRYTEVGTFDETGSPYDVVASFTFQVTST